MNRLSTPILLLLLLSVSVAGCPKSGRQPAGGPEAVLTVNGSPMHFPNPHFVFKKNELLGLHQLIITSGKEGDYPLLLTFDAREGSLADLQGKSLTKELDNPEKTFDYNYDTHIKSGEKWYLGYKLKASVLSTTEEEISLTLDCTFLEFSNADQTTPGSEVQVTGTVNARSEKER
jgi:hypothetical protein